MDNQFLFLTSAHWRQEVYRLIALKDAKQRQKLKLEQELEDVTAQIHNADGRFTQAELHEQERAQASAAMKPVPASLEAESPDAPTEAYPPEESPHSNATKE